MAVTHSRGKGPSGPIPGSDPAFEKSQWQRRREEGGRKGRKPSSASSRRGEFGDEDVGALAELDDEDVASLAEPHSELDFRVPAGSTGKETFHSMAEIASCSYEARKVKMVCCVYVSVHVSVSEATNPAK